MTLAQQRRNAALKRSNFYQALATGTAFVFLGHLSTYPDLRKGCMLILILGVLAINFQPMSAVINQLAAAPHVRRSKVNQLAGVLLANAAVPIIMFIVGGLI